MGVGCLQSLHYTLPHVLGMEGGSLVNALDEHMKEDDCYARPFENLPTIK